MGTAAETPLWRVRKHGRECLCGCHFGDRGNVNSGEEGKKAQKEHRGGMWMGKN